MTAKLTPMKWFVILLIIAVGLALGLPPDPESLRQLHISSLEYRIAILSLLIPYTIIWYAGFYAFAKLREYSKPLGGTTDGEAFRKITFGMGILAFGLIVPTIITLILGNIAAHHVGFEPAATIIDNYITLLLPLLSLFIIGNGTRILVRSVRGWSKKAGLRWFSPWFILLCVFFMHLTFNNYYVHNSYHLNLYVLMVTFVTPYLYAWLLGFLCAYELRLYARYVKGVLYKRALKRFSSGIAFTIGGSIAVQFVNVTLASRFNRSLGSLLIIEYILLIVVAIGLVLMALATKQLKKIEEV
jgi:hypothetical protein